MNSKRINISVNGDLHALSTLRAHDFHRTNFSQLITKLLVEDMKKSAAAVIPTLMDFIRSRSARSPLARGRRSHRDISLAAGT